MTSLLCEWPDKLSPLTAPCTRRSEVRVSWQGLTFILKVFNNPRSLKEAGHTHYPTLHHISVLFLHSLNNFLMTSSFLLKGGCEESENKTAKSIQAQFMDSRSENPAQHSKVSTNFDSREDQNILNMLAHVIIIPHRNPGEKVCWLNDQIRISCVDSGMWTTVFLKTKKKDQIQQTTYLSL